jgi:hypothetical protein
MTLVTDPEHREKVPANRSGPDRLLTGASTYDSLEPKLLWRAVAAGEKEGRG